MEKEREPTDEYPVGMRVLAIDDDPICLKLLDYLLQYNITTTTEVTVALDLLRECKGKFDLVISDVHMLDMDGFKLLELVGLEMDLPVIMLSANGDTKAVMKGISHGACDYLLKPIQIKEDKNIWQHVVRRFVSRSSLLPSATLMSTSRKLRTRSMCFLGSLAMRLEGLQRVLGRV